MGTCGIPGPVGCWAKELGERVAERVAELASVVITPLGGLSAHLLVMPKRSQPHRKQKVWSGTRSGHPPWTGRRHARQDSKRSSEE